MKNEPAELVLTCGSWQEAQNIADELLDKGLVACVEFMEVKSKYRWHDAVEQANEIKLIMLTEAKMFDEVEKVVDKLHSYETFVLHSLPISQVSTKAGEWIDKEING